jgi:diguanylate cyclase (GGDEF)-like protein
VHRGQVALRRVLPLLAPVLLAGLLVAFAAAVALWRSPPDDATWIGLAALYVAAVTVEGIPLRLRNLPAGNVALSAVFFIGAAVMFGTAAAVVSALAVRATVDIVKRHPPVRVLYNGPVYALAAAAAGTSAAVVGTESDARLVAAVVLAGASYYAINLSLVTAAIARAEFRPLAQLLGSMVRSTVFPFAIMTSGALTLVILWDRSPLLTLALVGPLVAIALYERSTQAVVVATRLALTDGLTGLGNQRHFHERLDHAVAAAERRSAPLSLCLLDVDGLKLLNDTQGHPAGDRMLAATAASLRHGGEAFRVGGDEFALLLPDEDERRAAETAKTVLERLAAEGIRVSCGVAVFPVVGRDDLYRSADEALYRSKREGLNRVVVATPRTPPPEVRSMSGAPSRTR